MSTATGKILIDLQYLPPISYFYLISRYGEVILEREEHYEKGTYRNRSYIAGPNGTLRLSIPLESGKNQRKKIKDVRISYDHPWQHIHWQSLCSSYRSSPYFEFYEHEFAPFYHNRFTSLFDYNLKLLKLLLRLLEMNCKISFTDSYTEGPDKPIIDWRSGIHPKTDKQKLIPGYEPPEYLQVFSDRTGFIPGLSVVDLLFNQGPESSLKLSL